MKKKTIKEISAKKIRQVRLKKENERKNKNAVNETYFTYCCKRI